MPNSILKVRRIARSSDSLSDNMRVSHVHVSGRLESMEDVKVHGETGLVLCEVFPHDDIHAC